MTWSPLEPWSSHEEALRAFEPKNGRTCSCWSSARRRSRLVSVLSDARCWRCTGPSSVDHYRYGACHHNDHDGIGTQHRDVELLMY